MNKIASRYWSPAVPVFYVSDLKGPIGDWGYTTEYKKALPLSPWWQRRFGADCARIGVTPIFCDPVPLLDRLGE